MLDLIAKYEHYIKSFQVHLYEQEGPLFRFKAELQLNDDSKIFIKEYVFKNNERKYAYHWTDASGNLICRWDNASHWPGISAFPHHKHIDSVLRNQPKHLFPMYWNRLSKSDSNAVDKATPRCNRQSGAITSTWMKTDPNPITLAPKPASLAPATWSRFSLKMAASASLSWWTAALPRAMIRR